jgi:epoxyqueuosine reductase
MKIPWPTIESLAADLRLGRVSGVIVDQMSAVLDRASERLGAWQSAGYAADMNYMQRSRELYASLQAVLPEARSVLSFLVPYVPEGGCCSSGPAPAGFGKVARYAWGRDYHKVLRRKLEDFVGKVRELFPVPEIKARVFSDAVPVLERSFAAGGGQGFLGKNSMLIRPGLGSFTFLCEVIWSAEIEFPPEAEKPQPAGPGESCGSCSRCLSACPTAALRGDGVLDARRCISYLTIEKRNKFSEWEAAAISDWVFGCDVCQEVCPFNHRKSGAAVMKEFSPQSGCGEFLNLVDLFELDSHEKFTDHFGGTAIMRAGREGLLRNACAVIANTNFAHGCDALRAARSNDPSPLVREEAERSLRRLLSPLSPA